MGDKEVQILGGKGRQVNDPKILSQNSVSNSGTPQIIDRTARQEPPHIEIVVHEDLITESDEIRKERNDGGPEVRIRHSPTGANFDKVKRGEDL